MAKLNSGTRIYGTATDTVSHGSSALNDIKLAQELYNHVRGGMGIKESTFLRFKNWLMG
jgi:hypothetical protein